MAGDDDELSRAEGAADDASDAAVDDAADAADGGAAEGRAGGDDGESGDSGGEAGAVAGSGAIADQAQTPEVSGEPWQPTPAAGSATGRTASERALAAAVAAAASAAARPAPSGPDDVIAGRYRLIRHIGSGGMGVVWQAKDDVLGRTVALKELSATAGVSLHGTGPDGAAKRAMREARIAARLHHPNVIAVYDVVQHGGRPWLVMEYLASRSLADVMSESGELPVDEVARIGAVLASALTAAHEAGIVHRDVKPANVLISDNGPVKLTDFGISRATGDTTVTGTGVVLGTVSYIAPEVARGKPADARSDVYSLGATLYAAVEGQPPFGVDDNVIALLYRIAHEEILPASRAGALNPVLKWMLERDPDRRPTTRQITRMLENIGLASRPAEPGGFAAEAEAAQGAAQAAPVREPDGRASGKGRSRAAAKGAVEGAAAAVAGGAAGTAGSVDQAASAAAALLAGGEAQAQAEAGAAAGKKGGSGRTPRPAKIAKSVKAFKRTQSPAPAPVQAEPQVAVPTPTPAPAPATDSAPAPVAAEADSAAVEALATSLARESTPAPEPTSEPAPAPSPGPKVDEPKPDPSSATTNDYKVSTGSTSATSLGESSDPFRSTSPSSHSASPAFRSTSPSLQTSDSGRRRAVIVGIAATLVLIVGTALLVSHSGNSGTAAVAGPSVSASRTPAATATPTPSAAATSSVSATPTPVLTTSAASVPVVATTAAGSSEDVSTQLADTITTYYQLMPGNTDEGWTYMTTDYQEHHANGRSNYDSFWAAVQSVSLSDLTVSLPSTVVVTIHYQDKNGSSATERTSFGMVQSGGRWLIASSSVLSHQGG